MKIRIKSEQDMPEEYKCCQETILAMKAWFGTEYIITGEMTEVNTSCPSCDRPLIGIGYILSKTKQWAVLPQMIDIDEGEANESNSNRTALSN